MMVTPENQQPIRKMLYLLDKPGKYIYVGVKDRRYIPIYMMRHFERIGYKFEYSQTKVRGIKNPDDFEEAHIYEIYRKS